MQHRFQSAFARAVHVFANLPIHRRVALVGLVPGIAALTLAGARLAQEYTFWSESRTDSAEIAAASQVGELVHELQRERGLSVRVVSGDASLGSQLTEQRAKVDAERRDLATRLAELASESDSADIAASIDALSNRLANITSLRQTIDTGRVATKDVVAYYTAPIADYIAYVDHVAGSTDNVELRQPALAFSALLHAKEAAGRERAAGAAIYTAGRLDTAATVNLGGQIAAQEVHFATIAENGSSEMKRAAMTLEGSSEARAVAALRLSLLAGERLDPRRAQEWWAATTRRIDAMQEVARDEEQGLRAIADRAAAKARLGFVLLAGFLLVFGAAMTALVMGVARGLVGPIQTLAEVTAQMTAGDFAVAVPVPDTREEIGQLGRQVRAFRDRLRAADEERAAHAAERDRHTELLEQRGRRVDHLTGSFDQSVNAVLAGFAEATRSLLATAQELDRKALESAERSAAVASASQQTNNNVRIVAEATEELSLSIEEIVRQVVGTAQGMAEVVGEVRRAHGDMAALRKAADEIGGVVTTIGDIAEQTTVLALNATIEAARAGDAGLGFAVVASEVRALADETGQATRSISAAIEEMTGKTRRAADGMDRIAVTIQTAEAANTAISAALEQQSMAARQIAQNVQEAACGVAQVDSNIVAIEAASSAARGEVEGVIGAATTVGQRAGSLEGQVQDFLASIRAA